MGIDSNNSEIEKIGGIREALATGFCLAREASFDEIVAHMENLAKNSGQPKEVTEPVIEQVRALQTRIAELLN